MTRMVEVRAIVRRELLDRVVHCLKDSGVPRLTVTRVHAIGAGVDPATARIAAQEGSEYADKAVVQFICADENCTSLMNLIATTARTGRPGDGIVSIHPVENVIKIRTGATGLHALD